MNTIIPARTVIAHDDATSGGVELNFTCECPSSGFCSRYQRNMPHALHAICRGERLTPQKCEAYRANWLSLVRSSEKKIGKASNSQENFSACSHLGAPLRTEICQFCKKRHKLIAVHACAVWGSCSIAPYRPGQPEPSCRGCGQFSPIPPAETPPAASGGAGIQLKNPIKIAAPAARPKFATPQAVQNPDQIVPESQVPRFTPREWRRLPENEKAFWRHQKKLREAAGIIQQVQPAGGEVAAQSANVTATTSPPATSQNPPHQSAFITPGGSPLDLSHFGAGGAAFLILSGPSLKTLNLSQLSRRGAWTLGVNNAPTLFRTNAWTFVDPVEKFHDGIWKDPGILKFVHRRYLGHGLRTRLADGKIAAMRDEGRRVTVREMPGVIAINRNADFEPSRWLSESSINWGQSKKSAQRAEREGRRYPRLLNVMVCALKIIYSLGFRQVYLLGCDFAMTPDAPYAFNEKKDPGAASMNNGMYPKLAEMLRLLKPHFDAAGYHVFNCNPQSGLTIFPHVPYKEALTAATSHVPQGVLDSLGWYTKGDNE